MIKLYTTGCPNCLKLEERLDEKGIEREVISDMSTVTNFLLSKGFRTVPVLEVDGELLDYRRAIEWLKGE